MRTLNFAAVLLLSLSVTGCFSDSSGPDEPRNTDSTGLIGILTPDFDLPTGFYAAWDPGIGRLPYPNDLLGYATDGTLNLPADSLALQILASEVNNLDGFSTFARATINFSEGIDPDSLDPAVNPLNAFAVVMVEVLQDPATKTVAGVAGPPLQLGVDFMLSPWRHDIDAGGTILQVMPLKPLNPEEWLSDHRYQPGAQH